ncbi:7256_t:CDS:10 [Ambispora leptoticha]|uniref:7256_t:CDS:1 n=1 Tax=Ambispora leptoticha TaxID=144679 RepID=A0A9N9AGU9_9GLOM|nr:7256_t:CDS:10 [Ambispora leptoticha]
MSISLPSAHTVDNISEYENSEIVEVNRDSIINISQSFNYGSAIKNPRQFRALSRLTLTLTVRNWKTNFCCIFITPLLMMIIMQFVIIAVYPGIKEDENKPQVVYCSNSNTYMNSTYGNIPTLGKEDGVFFHRNASSPKLLEDVVRPWILQSDQYFNNDASSSDYRSCSNLLTGNQDSYTTNPSPYFLSIENSDDSQQDTTYLPKPNNGWWNFNNSNNLLYDHVPQTFPYGYIVADGIDELSFATSDPATKISTVLNQLSTCINSNISEYSAKPEFQDIVSNLYECLNSSATRKDQGPFLNNVPHKYFNLPVNLENFTDQAQGISLSKANIKFDTGVFSQSQKSSVNQDLFSDFNETFAAFKTLALSQLSETNSSSNVTILNPLPHGAIIFDNLDTENGVVSYTLQYGYLPKILNIILKNNDIYNNPDFRQVLANNSNFASLFYLLLDYPSAGFRRLIASSQITNALSKGQVEIVAKLQAMPRKFDISELNPDVTAIIGWVFYPYAVSFLMPIFVMILVREKEERVFIIMKMSGLSAFKHMLNHYIEFTIMQAASCLVFYLIGFALQYTIFTRTDPSLLLLYFFIWVNVQVAMGFLFSSFFSKTRRAIVTVYVFVVLSAIISGITVYIFGNNSPPTLWYLHPSFAFYEGLRDITRRASLAGGLRPYDLGHLNASDELLAIMEILSLEWIVMMLLTLYLQAVLPTKYGIPKDYFFFITEPYNWAKRRFSSEEISALDGTKLFHKSIIEGLANTTDDNLKDPDIKDEERRILNNEINPSNCNLIVKQLVKVYRNKKLAVNRLSFSAEKNMVFGLLGPNGAGKSSAIHVMTGLYPPTAGTAYVAGYDIQTDMAKVYTEIGVCPQYDLLWSDLTIEEHLLFYARLRGVSPKMEKQAVEHALEQVELTKLKTRLTKSLSGGEKRRLSIAIALTGDSKVLFLDEPTTGLDPDVRRTIWGIIAKAKRGKTIILTTHSMEEADALCDKIGIVAAGQLRCLGSPLYLKTTHGSGFQLLINSSQLSFACSRIEPYITTPFRKIIKSATAAAYQFDANRGVISRLFKGLEEKKKEWGIVDYSITQSTLEDQIKNGRPPTYFDTTGRNVSETMHTYYRQHNLPNDPLELIVIILPKKISQLYGEIKKVSDTELGVPSQCIIADRLNKPRNFSTWTNLSMKINSKLGGCNLFLPKSSLPKAIESMPLSPSAIGGKGGNGGTNNAYSNCVEGKLDNSNSIC